MKSINKKIIKNIKKNKINSFYLIVMLLLFSLLINLSNSHGFVFDNRIGGNTYNPASKYCVDHDGKLVMRSDDNGQYGVCVFSDGSECEEWKYYKGECKPGTYFPSKENKNASGKYILFAHGMGADKSDWDYFAKYAEEHGYKVFRTNVGRCDSVATRAEKLAEYIKSLDIPDNSLKAVGHSMGGIDLRYIIGEAYYKHEPFYSAAKKINQVYTIGSPHGGSFALTLGKIDNCLLRIDGDCKIHYHLDLGSVVKKVSACKQSDPAWKSLTDDAMEAFNKKYTYDKFKVDGRQIGFLAFYFECSVCGGTSDCTVGTKSQTWEGAPKYSHALKAVHSKDLYNNLYNAYKASHCSDLCNAQCETCKCRTINYGLGKATICPPKKDVCDSLCNSCRNACNFNPICPYELSLTSVIKYIIDAPLTSITSENTNTNKLKSINKLTLAKTKDTSKNNKINNTKNNNTNTNKTQINKTLNSNNTSLNNTNQSRNKRLKNKNESKENITKINNSNKNNFNNSNLSNQNKKINSNITSMKNNMKNKTSNKINNLNKELKYNKNNNKSENLNSTNTTNKTIKKIKENKLKNMNNKTKGNNTKEIKKIKDNINLIINKNSQNKLLISFKLNKSQMNLSINSEVNQEDAIKILNKTNFTITPIKLENKIKDKNIKLNSMELVIKNNKTYYELNIEQPAKLFWFFNTKVSVSYVIDPETGNVKSETQLPWYYKTNLLNFFS